MAELTGIKQASIAFYRDAVTGEALDRNGRPVRLSGEKQAVKLLQGSNNPDPSRFEVVGYFEPRAIVDGEPSAIPAPEDCPTGEVVGWILETGFWEMGNFWTSDGIWNY